MIVTATLSSDMMTEDPIPVEFVELLLRRPLRPDGSTGLESYVFISSDYFDDIILSVDNEDRAVILEFIDTDGQERKFKILDLSDELEAGVT